VRNVGPAGLTVADLVFPWFIWIMGVRQATNEVTSISFFTQIVGS
jgi:predicted acyltransferase